MQWTDAAIILNVRKYGENSAVVRVLSREHGVSGGIFKGAGAKSNRGIVQPGNMVNAIWQARLSEQLGSFRMEMLEPVAAFLMSDPMKLAALTSICAMVELSMPERHPYPLLYKRLTGFLHTLKEDGKENTLWQQAYIYMEMELLAQAGFGLDLRECAATGARDDLIYVSPKSGRAVSQDAGRPYHEKLLPLPAFLLAPASGEKTSGSKEILDGMRLTGYFLEHWLLEPHRRKLPAARARLLEMMKEHHAAETDS